MLHRLQAVQKSELSYDDRFHGDDVDYTRIFTLYFTELPGFSVDVHFLNHRLIKRHVFILVWSLKCCPLSPMGPSLQSVE